MPLATRRRRSKFRFRLRRGKGEGLGEQGVAAQACLVTVGDGVDDEFVEMKLVGHVGELCLDGQRGTNEVARELVGVGLGGAVGSQFEGGFFWSGERAAVVLADAELEQADGLREAFGFGLSFCADDADGGCGLRSGEGVGAEGGIGLEAMVVELDGLAGGVA